MWSYIPLDTPSGKPVNVGVVVATPAVPVPGSVVQQWMCEAVVKPVRPLKLTCTRIKLVTLSKWIWANPVPSEILGGDSFGPLRLANQSITPASALVVAAPSKRSERTVNAEARIMVFLHGVDTHLAPGGLNHAKT